MMEKAQAHLEAGELEQAEALLREAIDDHPDNAEALFLLAQVRQRRGDLDDALKLMRQVEGLDPSNPNIFHARGVLHITRKESEEAGRAFQQALEIDPKHIPSRVAQAFLELAEGRFEAALEAAERALTVEPENAQALTYLGTALLELGHPERAIDSLQAALRVEPETLTARAQLGRAHLAAGNAARAVESFQTALERAPGSADLLEFLGRARIEMGEVPAARQSLREAVEKGRANPDLFRDLAACEAAAGRPREGEALLAAAIQMVPDRDGPREDLVLPLAGLLIARGATDGALAALNTLVQAGRNSETVDVLVSQAQLEAGNVAAAIAAVGPRVESGDASVEARLALVQALEADGQEARAAAALDALLAEDPPDTEVLFYRAAKWFAAGDEAAIDALQDLVNRRGLSAQRLFESRRLLAEALHRAERYPEAAGQYAALASRRADMLTVDADFEGSGVDPTTAMDPVVTADWPRSAPDDGRPNPVFIIGWPGSGQERLLPALAAHPDLRVVLDSPASQGERRAQVDRPRGADALGKLDDTQVRLRRGRYWNALKRLGVKPGSGVVLDAMWITVESLPTIARLFAGARVLVVTRDARDMSVAWMMAGYRDLGVMAEVYGRQQALLARCRDALPLAFVDVDYDVVEAEPQDRLADLQRDLGLEPDPGVFERFGEVALPVPVKRGDYRHYAARPEDAEEAPGSDAVH